jgi:hypothetical protein
MPDARRPTHRSAFGASAGGAKPPLDPPLAPGGPADGGGGWELAPWRRPSGSWRYRPAWFQPGGPAPAAAAAPRKARSGRGRVLLAAGACALAVAVLVAGTLLVAKVGGPGRGARAVASAGAAVLPAGTVVLTGDSYTTMLPAGWQEVPANGLETRAPPPDERAAVGRGPSGLDPMVMIEPYSGPRGPIQELAADELRAEAVGGQNVDIDGPRLRTVAGAQAAVLDIDARPGAPELASRLVLIVHGQRVLRLSLVADAQNVAAARQAVDVMLAAWRWTG